MHRLRALGETQPVLRVLQIDTVAEAKILVPRKTGHLGRSIVPGTLTPTHAQVEARTPYAVYVERGLWLPHAMYFLGLLARAYVVITTT